MLNSIFSETVILCVSLGVQLWRHRWMFFQERHHLFTPMKRRVSETPVAGTCSGCAGVQQTIAQFCVSLHGDKTQVLFHWHRDKRRLCKVQASGIRYAVKQTPSTAIWVSFSAAHFVSTCCFLGPRVEAALYSFSPFHCL